jgi:hypothetical protein
MQDKPRDIQNNSKQGRTTRANIIVTVEEERMGLGIKFARVI